MSRRIARDEAVKILYQMAVVKNDTPFSEYEPVSGLGEKDIAYLKTVVSAAMEEDAALSEEIAAHSKRKAYDRIPLLLQAILKLAIVEIRGMEDIPVSVSINEAVELAKTYDSPEGGVFVNGVLGAIVRDDESREKEQ